jgi:hypothetical protein
VALYWKILVGCLNENLFPNPHYFLRELHLTLDCRVTKLTTITYFPHVGLTYGDMLNTGGAKEDIEVTVGKI